MLTGVQLQIKFTKARMSYYLMNKTADTKTTYKFLNAYLRAAEPSNLVGSRQGANQCGPRAV